MKSIIATVILLVSVAFVSATVINVPADVTTIQAGIDSASVGDTVLVASGTYYENLDYNGKDIVVLSVDGPDSTIIDGSSNGAVILIRSGESKAAVLDGFTIQNGSGETSLNIPTALHGGGICVRYSSNPTLRNLIVTDNTALGTQSSGGGIGISTGSESLIENVIIRNNESYYGGGLFSYFSSPTLTNVTIYDNQAKGGSGGGAAFQTSTPVLDHILVYNNIATVGGGGGLWFHDQNEVTAHAITIVGNTCSSTYGGGGLLTTTNNTIYLLNSICWNNTPNQIASYVSGQFTSGNIGVAYSDIQGGQGGLSLATDELTFYEHNIDADPSFSNSGLGNFELTQGSSCIDAGCESFTAGSDLLLELDLGSYIGKAPDMGAFESPYSTVGVDTRSLQPNGISLYQNFPNPFNPTTLISYSLDISAHVKLEIFDIRGQHIATLVSGNQEHGLHQATWDGTNTQGKPVQSGIYQYRLVANDIRLTQRMILLR